MKKGRIAVFAVMAAVTIGVAVFLIVKLAGGIRYKSSFAATMCVESSRSKSAKLDFGSMKGTKVLKMKHDGSDNAYIEYSGKIGSGKLTVYYDDDGTKKELFSLSAGERADSVSEPLKKKGTVYIIIETDGKCTDGNFEFKIKKK